MSVQTDACAVGASAFHLNTGERWIVVAHHGDGRLEIERASDAVRRRVWRVYWLSESWADR